MLIGAVLALTWIILGFWAFFFVVIAMLIGGLIGRILDGKLNASALVDVLRGRNTSS
ncbi:hypothetical protein C5E07_13355 [Pseudoclavibacter sp. RFBJ3]|nr:hypothetical protein C5B99_14600 [Pseudoclavibacter sp. Z016]PPF82715.1 hypothetical protein C5C12_12430 [Pseudoclavibacter sp. RFBJ5]PPF91609.1 hypothetical protein C5E07_13355 [Pseudoclavibacter sp. RFBJ3]PPF94287.1 hypothetical protein C5C19_18615 [Pseudoclavibacter sp. RFBH5]PPG00710.1 hypothetical protein C5E06_18440 [Pseudoclavibacter sp. RFBI5]PPG22279.1 hypothetical protein C5E13_12680 [Pseudoclavibacter sp. RFBI4]